MKQFTLLMLCLGALEGCMMTPETSDEHRDPAAKDLAGAEKIGKSEDALLGIDIDIGVDVQSKCSVGTLTIAYTPGLTFELKPVSVAFTGTFSGCVFPAHPSITSGVLELGVPHGELSCKGNQDLDRYSQTIRWNDGSSSTLSVFVLFREINYANIARLFTIRGEITDGVLKDDEIAIRVPDFEYPVACRSNAGLTHDSRPATLTIDPL